MPKRQRIRARARRPIEMAQQPESAARERPERPRYRGAPPPLASGRAVGQPSAGMERAASLERAYVVKDLRRLGIVIVAMLALLAIGGFIVDLVVR